MAKKPVSSDTNWPAVGAICGVIALVGGLAVYVLNLHLAPIGHDLAAIKKDVAELRGVDSKTGERYTLTETELRGMIAALGRTQEGHGRDILYIKEGVDGLRVTVNRIEDRLLKINPISFEVKTDGQRLTGDEYKAWVEQAVQKHKALGGSILVVPDADWNSLPSYDLTKPPADK